VLHLRARWFDFLTKALRRYETDVRPALPDVLVIHFGVNEAQPWLLPVWLVRHLLAHDQAVTRPARAWRRYVAGPLWVAVRGYRRRLSPLIGTWTWQTTPRRFEGTLRRAIRIARAEFQPLVLVVDLCAPGPLLERYLPGSAIRHDRIRCAIEQAVASCADPDVRLVRASGVVAALGVDDSVPDGMHFTAEAHRRLGKLLADEVRSRLIECKPDPVRTGRS
jgi:lysophospholipase L1-like esterase